ncbi:MAG: CoB--CoM heterodisulfide reductase iron-sulfur subunit A family protein [Methanomassiliicoccales archaeon]|jgi:heterodisulfide reductase subunit A|nr:CoB--CoM heterodisulfide reductase iron-sulfur subunit A family protein [Methanomassiliicoccales archaeon]
MERSVLVVGSGVAGIQASLDLADKGVIVHLVEKDPSIGGRMAQLDKTFPTNDCSICILAPKMADCYGHPNINVLTYSELIGLDGHKGRFKAKVLKKARYVDESKCTGCGECLVKCPTKGIPSEFEMGLSTRRAIYMPFLQAVPRVATIDREHCKHLTEGKCGVCKKVCKREAIDYEMKDAVLEFEVGAVIVATGFDVWNPMVASEYGYGRFPNVFIAMEYERIINAAGPTSGHIRRRSDGGEPRTIAFIQCVGSRNVQLNHPYCCSVCCMHSTKEAMLAKEHKDDVKTTIFYKDMRACAKGFYEYVVRAQRDYNVEYVNSDATVQEETEDHNPVVSFDVGGRSVRKEFDMVVLATSLVPRATNAQLSKVLGVQLDEFGFIKSKDRIFSPVETNVPGIYVAGYCGGPADIPESVAQGSAAAAKAAETLVEARVFA